MASKLEIEVQLTSTAEKFWACITDSTDLFPKIFPQQYQSIQIVEGDGKSVGSIRLVNYAEGIYLYLGKSAGIPFVKFAKEKIEVADEANKLVSYSVIEGEILNFYKSFIPTLQVVPKGDGAVAKWTVEYEKVNDEVPDPAGIPFAKFAKEKIEVANEANKLVSYNVIEGEILNYCKSFSPTL